jgi:hypothetical protein
MRIPNFEKLKQEIQESPDFLTTFNGSYMHPKATFYKYYWWVFCIESPCDANEFLTNEHRLSTKKAMDLIDKLKSEGQHCWIYNRRVPRLDPNNPFDVNSKVWCDAKEWAKSFDDDTDELYDGHK